MVTSKKPSKPKKPYGAIPMQPDAAHTPMMPPKKKPKGK